MDLRSFVEGNVEMLFDAETSKPEYLWRNSEYILVYLVEDVVKVPLQSNWYGKTDLLRRQRAD